MSRLVVHQPQNIIVLKGVRHGQARHHTPERRLERQGNDLARRIGQKRRPAIG
ncbi:protein of unassigned function [Methylobacterium oryzae CBMB20]|uniref:Protein of unassigned function n=1 Tax=Methylobacterium oryzae CBMB20 TaxID=693986 RepID=A0A089NYQ4_9HYPH|nr:protein of unassigned function [Methylobacterium oryzae CBMB20]